MANDIPVIASPEWATAVRNDIKVDERVGGGWVATPAPLSRHAAYTDFAQHIMAVPAGDDRAARGVRFHELAHARYSPTIVPGRLVEQLGLPLQTVRIAEELRINLVMAQSLDGLMTTDEYSAMQADVRAMADGTEKGAADNAAERDDFRQAVYLLYSTYGLDSFSTVKRRLRLKPEWKDAVENIAKHLKKKYPKGYYRQDSRVTSTAPAQFSWRERFAIESVILPYGFVNTTIPIATEIEQIIEAGGVGAERVRKSGKPTSDEPDEPNNERPVRMSSSQWESLRFGMTSLTETTSSFVGRRKRPSVTGKFPSRPDRLLTDPERRIFRDTVRGHGGIVVFDCSGSMGVNYDVVRETVKQFAGATILAYSHNGPNSANAWVLARGGRMISRDEMHTLRLNRGNGVDGLALRWAVRERRSPKDFIVWVSDCGVTGVNDTYSHDLLLDCADLCRRYNITQVDNCRDAMALLAEMKRNGGVPRRRWSRELAETITAIEKGTSVVPVISIRSASELI